MKTTADKFHAAIGRDQHWPGHLPDQEVHWLRLLLAVVLLLSKLGAKVQNQFSATVRKDPFRLFDVGRVRLYLLVFIAFERPKALPEGSERDLV
jgi:hypothetical protein